MAFADWLIQKMQGSGANAPMPSVGPAITPGPPPAPYTPTAPPNQQQVDFLRLLIANHLQNSGQFVNNGAPFLQPPPSPDPVSAPATTQSILAAAAAAQAQAQAAQAPQPTQTQGFGGTMAAAPAPQATPDLGSMDQLVQQQQQAQAMRQILAAVATNKERSDAMAQNFDAVAPMIAAQNTAMPDQLDSQRIGQDVIAAQKSEDDAKAAAHAWMIRQDLRPAGSNPDPTYDSPGHEYSGGNIFSDLKTFVSDPVQAVKSIGSAVAATPGDLKDATAAALQVANGILNAGHGTIEKWQAQDAYDNLTGQQGWLTSYLFHSEHSPLTAPGRVMAEFNADLDSWAQDHPKEAIAAYDQGVVVFSDGTTALAGMAPPIGKDGQPLQIVQHIPPGPEAMQAVFHAQQGGLSKFLSDMATTPSSYLPFVGQAGKALEGMVAAEDAAPAVKAAVSGANVLGDVIGGADKIVKLPEEALMKGAAKVGELTKITPGISKIVRYVTEPSPGALKNIYESRLGQATGQMGKWLVSPEGSGLGEFVGNMRMPMEDALNGGRRTITNATGGINAATTVEGIDRAANASTTNLPEGWQNGVKKADGLPVTPDPVGPDGLAVRVEGPYKSATIEAGGKTTYSVVDGNGKLIRAYDTADAARATENILNRKATLVQDFPYLKESTDIPLYVSADNNVVVTKIPGADTLYVLKDSAGDYVGEARTIQGATRLAEDRGIAAPGGALDAGTVEAGNAEPAAKQGPYQVYEQTMNEAPTAGGLRGETGAGAQPVGTGRYEIRANGKTVSYWDDPQKAVARANELNTSRFPETATPPGAAGPAVSARPGTPPGYTPPAEPAPDLPTPPSEIPTAATYSAKETEPGSGKYVVTKDGTPLTLEMPGKDALDEAARLNAGGAEAGTAATAAPTPNEVLTMEDAADPVKLAAFVERAKARAAAPAEEAAAAAPIEAPGAATTAPVDPGKPIGRMGNGATLYETTNDAGNQLYQTRDASGNVFGEFDTPEDAFNGKPRRVNLWDSKPAAPVDVPAETASVEAAPTEAPSTQVDSGANDPWNQPTNAPAAAQPSTGVQRYGEPDRPQATSKLFLGTQGDRDLWEIRDGKATNIVSMGPDGKTSHFMSGPDGGYADWVKGIDAQNGTTTDFIPAKDAATLPLTETPASAPTEVAPTKPEAPTFNPESVSFGHDNPMTIRKSGDAWELVDKDGNVLGDKFKEYSDALRAARKHPNSTLGFLEPVEGGSRLVDVAKFKIQDESGVKQAFLDDYKGLAEKAGPAIDALDVAGKTSTPARELLNNRTQKVLEEVQLAVDSRAAWDNWIGTELRIAPPTWHPSIPKVPTVEFNGRFESFPNMSPEAAAAWWKRDVEGLANMSNVISPSKWGRLTDEYQGLVERGLGPDDGIANRVIRFLNDADQEYPKAGGLRDWIERRRKELYENERDVVDEAGNVVKTLPNEPTISRQPLTDARDQILEHIKSDFSPEKLRPYAHAPIPDNVIPPVGAKWSGEGVNYTNNFKELISDGLTSSGEIAHGQAGEQLRALIEHALAPDEHGVAAQVRAGFRQFRPQDPSYSEAQELSGWLKSQRQELHGHASVGNLVDEAGNPIKTGEFSVKEGGTFSEAVTTAKEDVSKRGKSVASIEPSTPPKPGSGGAGPGFGKSGNYTFTVTYADGTTRVVPASSKTMLEDAYKFFNDKVGAAAETSVTDAAALGAQDTQYLKDKLAFERYGRHTRDESAYQDAYNKLHEAIGDTPDDVSQAARYESLVDDKKKYLDEWGKKIPKTAKAKANREARLAAIVSDMEEANKGLSSPDDIQGWIEDVKNGSGGFPEPNPADYYEPTDAAPVAADTAAEIASTTPADIQGAATDATPPAPEEIAPQLQLDVQHAPVDQPAVRDATTPPAASEPLSSTAAGNAQQPDLGLTGPKVRVTNDTTAATEAAPASVAAPAVETPKRGPITTPEDAKKLAGPAWQKIINAPDKQAALDEIQGLRVVTGIATPRTLDREDIANKLADYVSENWDDIRTPPTPETVTSAENILNMEPEKPQPITLNPKIRPATKNAAMSDAKSLDMFPTPPPTTLGGARGPLDNIDGHVVVTPGQDIEPLHWNNEPPAMVRLNGKDRPNPYATLWDEAKAKPTLEEGKQVFDDYAQGRYGDRPQTYNQTYGSKGTYEKPRAGQEAPFRNWQRVDREKDTFAKDWMTHRGDPANPWEGGRPPADKQVDFLKSGLQLQVIDQAEYDMLNETRSFGGKFKQEVGADGKPLRNKFAKDESGKYILEGGEQKRVWDVFYEHLADGKSQEDALKETVRGFSPDMPIKQRRKIVDILVRMYKAINTFGREHRMYSWYRGPLGIASDMLGDLYTQGTSGHLSAIANSMDGVFVKSAYKDIRQGTFNALADSSLGRTLDLVEVTPRSFNSLDTRAESTVSGSLAVDRFAQKIARGLGAGEERAAKIAKITRPLADEHLRDMREAMDITRRFSLYGDTFKKGLEEQRPAFFDEIVSRAGSGEGDANKLINALGDEFGPSDVRRLAPQAGFTDGATEDMARKWRSAVNGLDRTAFAEQNRVAFDFAPTRLDELLKQVFLFHSWQVRAAPLYLGNAIRNPALANAYMTVVKDLREDSARKGGPSGYVKFLETAAGYTMFMNPVALVSSAIINVDPQYQNVNATTLDKILGHMPALVAPAFQGIISGIGLSSKHGPDILSLENDRKLVGGFVNYLRAESGSHSLGASPYASLLQYPEMVTTAAQEWIGTSIGIKSMEGTRFTGIDSNSNANSLIQTRIRDLVYQQYGVPLDISGTNLAIQYPAAFEALLGPDGALNAWQLQKANQYSDQAYKDYAKGALGAVAMTAITPGGIKLRSGSQDELTRDRDLGSPDAKSGLAISRLGSPEAVSLEYGTDKAAAAGTETGRALVQQWNDKERAFEAQGMDYKTAAGQADAWLQTQGEAAVADYQATKDASAAVTASVPIATDYKGWAKAIRGMDPVQLDRITRSNPDYYRYMEEQRKLFGNDPIRMASIAASHTAYLIYNGDKPSVYDNNPGTLNNNSQPIDIQNTGSGSGSSSSSSSDPATQLANDIQSYNTKMAYFQQAIAQYMQDPKADYDQMNPMLQAAVRRHMSDIGMSMPTPPASIDRYTKWAQIQKANGKPTDMATYTKWLGYLGTLTTSSGLDPTTAVDMVLSGQNPFASPGALTTSGATSSTSP